MEPTPRAVEIGPQLRQGLMQLQLAVMDAEFAPATTERQFVIACSDYASAAIVPGLMARLRTGHPVPACAWCPPGGVAEAMQAGRVDLAIGSFGHVAGSLRL